MVLIFIELPHTIQSNSTICNIHKVWSWNSSITYIGKFLICLISFHITVVNLTYLLVFFICYIFTTDINIITQFLLVKVRSFTKLKYQNHDFLWMKLYFIYVFFLTKSNHYVFFTFFNKMMYLLRWWMDLIFYKYTK